MALQFRATDSIDTTSTGFATTLTVNKPTGTVDGDFMLLQMSSATPSTLTPPAGWTLIDTASLTGEGASGNKMSVYWKIAASEGASYVCDFGAIFQSGSLGVITWYSDIAADIVVDIYANSLNASATTSHVAPDVTTTRANSALHSFYSVSGTAAGTPHSGMDERWDKSGAAAAYLMTAIVAAIGATGTRTMTGANTTSGAITVAIAEDLVPPIAPSGLTATTISQTQIDLAWNDNSSDETGFKVEWSPTGAGSWTLLTTTAADVESYSHTSLTANTQYYYRVSATNAIGDSGYTTDDATTLPVAPTAPSGLSAVGTSASIILLNWTDNSSNETGFEVERSPDGSGSWTLINTTAANATSYSNTGLTEATTYYYRVRAVNTGGNSSYTSVDDGLTYPAAPSGLVAFAPDDTQIDLTWNDNSAGETSEKVERSADGLFGWTLIATLSANDEDYSNTGLLPGATWYYRIGATNASGTTYSSVASTITVAAPQLVWDIRHQVYFDWDRDGNFDDEDDYLVSAKGTHRLAPPGQSITATSGQVAQCTIVLDNTTGRFSSFNSGGPLYSYIQSGKSYHIPVLVQISVEPAGSLSAGYNRVFTGVARIPTEATLTGDSAQTITFDCRGNEEIYLNKRARTLQADFKTNRDDGITEGEFIAAVLDAAGVDVGDTEIDDGLFTIPFAWLENESIIESCWQLAALCGGRFYCDQAGNYCYENATHWLTGVAHTTSQHTYTRGAGFGNLELVWDEAELAQEVTVSYTERDTGQADVVFDSSNLQVGAGLTKTIYADFSAAVYEITALDYTAGTPGGTDLSADVTVTPTYYAQSAKLVVANASGLGANVRIKISGKAVEDGEQKTIAPESVDTFWTDIIGRSRKVSGGRWVQSENQADMLAQLMRARQDAPTLVAKLKKCPGFSDRALGDRITIVDAEMDLASTPFYVTAISWSYSSRGGYTQELEAYRVSDLFPHADTSPGYLVLGVNKLGSADALRGRVFF
jgi:hypothetical protein